MAVCVSFQDNSLQYCLHDANYTQFSKLFETIYKNCFKQWQVGMTAILLKWLSQGISCDITAILIARWLITVWSKATVWDCCNVTSQERWTIRFFKTYCKHRNWLSIDRLGEILSQFLCYYSLPHPQDWFPLIVITGVALFWVTNFRPPCINTSTWIYEMSVWEC